MERIVFECNVKPWERQKLKKIFKWCLNELYSVHEYNKGASDVVRYKATEDKVTEIVHALPKLKYMKKKSYIEYELTGVATIAEIALREKMYKLLKECCEPKATLIKVKNHFTIFESLVTHLSSQDKLTTEQRQKIVDVIMNALQEKKVIKYKNPNNENFGMFCARFLENAPELKPVVELFIKNPETALMQDIEGFNIGMYCALYEHKELFELAYKNPQARNQRNNKGETMALIANNNGMLVPPLTEEDLYAEYSNIYEEQIKNLCK